MKIPEHPDDEFIDIDEEIYDEDSAEHHHTKAEYDAHANDLEHLDVGEMIEDAVEFFGDSPPAATPAK